jgi:formylglycine-generating enzyme required for sulfatase activity
LATARNHAPRSPSGTRYIDYSEASEAFVIPSSDKDGDAWDPDWPIMMVNQLDAQAYCKWMSKRSGHAIRLPTEEEWEYTARGADGRVYPWGNGYDRLISCSSRGMRNDRTASGERNGPARIDEFPYDISPFGVRHMGGIAIEWTSSQNHVGKYVMRGGGLFSTGAWCRAATRYAHPAEDLGVQFGFRVAQDLPG